jgi:presenilin-like A22 family membrane protease
MAKKRNLDSKEFFPIMIMGCLFLLVHGLSLLIIQPFHAAGMEAFENPNDLLNIAVIFLIIIVITVVILLIAKFWKKKLIQLIVLGAIGYTSAYVLYPLFYLLLPVLSSYILSITIAVLLVVMLYKYPEWYVIDTCGIIVGTGAIAIFGISLGVLLVILLLLVLAIYDAVSVYKTKHMIDLADTVMDLKLPVLLIVPKTRHYSLLRETKRLKEKLEQKGERDAFFMGLGDIVMPGILVTAVYHNIHNGLPIALSVITGTLIGFILLMSLVIKGKPQAGLPFLCGGAISGYILSSYLLFGRLAGLTIPM